MTAVVGVDGSGRTHRLRQLAAATTTPGNGSGIRQPIAMDPGEKYTYLGGSLTPAGQRVYITGEVPFRYTLHLR